MSKYLTIKEVSELTGKSDKTIRRNIIDVQDRLNKSKKIKIVTKQGSKYLILKSYITEFYGLNKDKGVSSQMTSQKDEYLDKKNNLTSQKDEYLDRYVSQLKDENEDLKKVRDQLLESNKELTRQNDQSQRLVAQLQQTNSQLLLGEREEKKMVTAEKEKDSNSWIYISLGVFLLLVLFVYFLTKQIL